MDQFKGGGSRTGPKSLLSVAIYPNDDAAEKGLDRVKEYLKGRTDGVEDTFFMEGPVGLNHANPMKP